MHAATDISTLRRTDVFFAKHLCACSARRKFCGVVVVPILAPYYVEAIGPGHYYSILDTPVLAKTGYWPILDTPVLAKT
jgi:multisubunit Na+/H+ antiporter MnhG subunit